MNRVLSRFSTRNAVLIQIYGRFAALLFALSLAGCETSKPDYAVLFGNNTAGLTAANMTNIYANFAAMFPLSADGLRLEDENCGDIAPSIEITDLNDDNQNEVFIQWGNACTSGMTGRSLSIFVADNAGKYQHQLGFPALGYTALTPGIDGFPDLKFGGPGFCFAVRAWDGDSYEFKCNQPQITGGCDVQGKLCPAPAP